MKNQPPAPPGTLLVVDDDLTMLKYMDAVLASHGFVCHLALSVRDAARTLRSQAVDAALCDFHMPRLSGLDFLRLVRSEATTGALPVAVITTDLTLPSGIADEIDRLGGLLKIGILPRGELVALARSLCAGRPC